MNRRGFTLVELLVSIALFGLIAVLLFGTIDELRKQHRFYRSKEGTIVEKNRMISLLRTDFDRAQSITVQEGREKDFDIVSINSSNRSLYGIYHPYVIWAVLKKENRLVRVESAYPISLPLSLDSLYVTHSDTIGKGCELFRVYDSPNHRMIYLAFENRSPIIIETRK